MNQQTLKKRWSPLVASAAGQLITQGPAVRKGLFPRGPRREWPIVCSDWDTGTKGAGGLCTDPQILTVSTRECWMAQS